MRVQDALSLPCGQDLRAVQQADLTRPVKVAHVVDMAEVERWVSPGTFLLSTGLSWPHSAQELKTFGQTLAACEPAAVVLAVPRYFPTFPPEVSDALAAHGIPSFELPWAVPFVQVVQDVHTFILREQSEELSRSERIHRALTRAALSGNLLDVARTLGEQLGREVILTGRDGHPLTTGDAPPVSALRAALHRPGNAARRVGGGLLTPVVLRGAREGGVWVSGPTSDDLTVRAAEHAATVTGLLLLAQQDADLREARLGYAFVDTLLEGRFTGDPSTQERAARLGFQPEGTYRVGLLVLNTELPLTPEGFAARERAAAHLREVLISLGTAPLISVNLNYVWFLLPGHVSAERVWARLGWATANPPPGGMVYGRERLGIPGITQGRAEVMTLAAYARPGELHSYAEVLVPRALSGDPDAQKDVIATLIDPLRTARGSAALLDTIRALSSAGFAQAEAAQALGIHINTLRYRMERIETLTGRPLGDPHHRSLWWLALQLEAMHR